MSRVANVAQVVVSRNLSTAVRNKLGSGPRRILRRPVPSRTTWSARRINQLHAAIPQMKHYLEIGLAAGRTFENVSLPYRVGVDPHPQFDVRHLPKGLEVFVRTSDEFFAANNADFDVVFLDGLHTYQQTYRDLMNALRYCARGAILVDDVVPCDEISAMPNQVESLSIRERRGLQGRYWHGDVFRMTPCIVDHHPELEVRTIIGDDNPQMLVWKPDLTIVTKPVADEVLSSYGSVSYGSTFANGVPDKLRPTGEEDALSDAITALHGRFNA